MNADHSGVSVPVPQMDVHPAQPLSFSNDMSNDQLAEWLRNHPSLTGIEYEEDISKLRGTLHDNVLIHFFVLNIVLVLQ